MWKTEKDSRDQKRAPTIVTNVAAAAIRRAALLTSNVNEAASQPSLELLFHLPVATVYVDILNNR